MTTPRARFCQCSKEPKRLRPGMKAYMTGIPGVLTFNAPECRDGFSQPVGEIDSRRRLKFNAYGEKILADRR